MTYVCSMGLDMMAILGDTPIFTISGMIADEMAIGMVNQKTTTARLIPVIGKKANDSISLGELFDETTTMPVTNTDAPISSTATTRCQPPYTSSRIKPPKNTDGRCPRSRSSETSRNLVVNLPRGSTHDLGKEQDRE